MSAIVKEAAAFFGNSGGKLSTILVYLLAGCVSGFLSGLFGVGGGAIIVPVLLVVFASQGIPEEVMMHMAVGGSLAVIMMTSVSSIRAHWQRGGVLWPVALRLAPGIIGGALLAAFIADWMSADLLRLVFAVFLVGMALKMALDLHPKIVGRLPGAAGMTLAGGVIGALASLVGIGGGILTVPFLTRSGISIQQAVGTSAACGFPIAAAGTAGFILAGWDHSALPPLTTGYVYWPAVGGIALAGVLVAPLGARLAHWLSQLVLQRLFAAFLAVVAVKVLMG